MDIKKFMDSIKMYHFIQNLRKQADEIGDGESLHASGGYYGKASAYREIADKLERSFK